MAELVYPARVSSGDAAEGGTAKVLSLSLAAVPALNWTHCKTTISSGEISRAAAPFFLPAFLKILSRQAG